MPDMFSTNVLMGVVQNLKTPAPYFLNRYFTTQFEDPSEEIHFDVIPGKRRVAPFVSPFVEGRVVDSLGAIAKTFKPAYIKDKRVFQPGRFLKRAVGETIGGSLSPEQRMQLHLATELQDQVDMINRRLEVMASEALRLGTVTVVGESYPSVTVNFGRTAGNTIADRAGATLWSAGTGVPLDNLQDWGTTGLQNSGAFPIDVYLGVDAWKAFRTHASVKDRLLGVKNTDAALNLGAIAVEGGQYMGTIDNFNIHVYGGWYVDPATGTETAIFPAKGCLMTSTMVEGVRAFGAIQDEKAGLQAVPYFPKSWTTEDPAVRYLMTQSAPLVVPTRPDATVYCNVVTA
jgi:hypothetical protein